MEIQVTQEQVDAVIESIVRKELGSLEVYDDYYGEFRKRSIGEYLECKVKYIVEEYLKEKLDTIVDTEKSPGSIKYRIKNLRAEGLLEYEDFMPRTIRLTGKGEQACL